MMELGTGIGKKRGSHLYACLLQHHLLLPPCRCQLFNRRVPSHTSLLS
jgi:hypothetical protein